MQNGYAAQYPHNSNGPRDMGSVAGQRLPAKDLDIEAAVREILGFESDSEKTIGSLVMLVGHLDKIIEEYLVKETEE